MWGRDTTWQLAREQLLYIDHTWIILDTSDLVDASREPTVGVFSFSSRHRPMNTSYLQIRFSQNMTSSVFEFRVIFVKFQQK